ncbi:MAG: sensor histidine kinase [Methylocella sp.]
MELRFTDGSAVAILSQANPLRAATGQVVGAVAACLDISKRKRIEDHRLLLLNELNHRVKNTLATVQSLAAQSFRGSATDAAARELFEARLMALSRAHNVLTRENWEGADLREIVAQGILPYESDNAERFEINGPSVRLSAQAALAISMALHELATNAVKYGALSDEKGHVEITWETAGRQWRIEWSESGGPPIIAPREKGFGSRLIERGLAQELGGKTRIEFRPARVFCEITAPLRGRG